ncbi:MAG: hypothetical protein B6U94_03335 [Thermofilum sp. ex4484_79]|nr:MAG: hypothetical protein B6U94_03335 [Thermofilum sp. ex4484_79]RLE58261.1 MAG: hypothetical protein DRJ35_08230 [Thermoprotei archaeon]
MGKRVVTLVTRVQARKDTVFSIRVLPRCRRCELFKICMGKLREGMRYRVLEVRNTKHVCPLINDYMYVALVEEMPVVLALEKGKAINGVTMQYSKNYCNEVRCAYYSYCVNNPILDGEKIKIGKLLKSIPCPRGLRLVLVEAEVLH